MTPYYQDDAVTIYHGDCREVGLPMDDSVLVTDPPYPNNAGWFDEWVDVARESLSHLLIDGLIFWSELERPPLRVPLVAVHIWHRNNVNGRPYEPIYQFAQDGRKRRSEVFSHPAIFDGAGPGCHEYLGHPTQKPVALMRKLIARTSPQIVIDPFMGSGSTLEAAKSIGRKAIGIEIDERYCEIAARRCSQEVLGLSA